MSFESVLNPVTFNREVNLYFNEKKISKVFNKFLRRSSQKTVWLSKSNLVMTFLLERKKMKMKKKIIYYFLQNQKSASHRESGHSSLKC